MTSAAAAADARPARPSTTSTNERIIVNDMASLREDATPRMAGLTNRMRGPYRPSRQSSPPDAGPLPTSSSRRVTMRRITLTSFALALGVGLAWAKPAPAQQAPPVWKQGQPAEQANSPLAPVPLPPTPTPAKDIHVDAIKLPPGFTISVWADGLHNARQLARGSRGTLFVGSLVAGNVYAVVDRDGRREVRVIAKGLAQPSGVAFKDGALYVAEIPRLLKYENIEASLDNPPAPKVVYEFPKDAHHNWRFLLW